MPPAPEAPLNVLWTGGWDSSYRVLHLAIVEQKTVAPLYFQSPWRDSTSRELRAIELILAALATRFPEARARILPLRLLPMDPHMDPGDPFIADLTALRSTTRLGPQYALLARELHHLDLDDVELCIHVGDPAGEFPRLFRDRLESVLSHGLVRHRLARTAGRDAVSRIFSRFLFPLHNITKLQTRALARTHGFEPLLHHTWFCYHPRSGRPCGACNPCHHAIADGFGWRIGPAGRLRHLLRRRLPARWPALGALLRRALPRA